MIKNIVKMICLICIAIFSLKTASFFINNYLYEVESREKTLADLIIAEQMKESLKEAEQKIAEETIDIVIESEKVELKEAVIEPIYEEILEEEIVEVEPEVLQEVEEEIVDEVGQDEVTLPEIDELEDLTGENSDDITTFFIENYFLNGYLYADLESDPEIKLRKEQARDMEEYAIEALNQMMLLQNVLISFDFSGVSQIKESIHIIYDEFLVDYEYISENDGEFYEIFVAIDNYFIKVCEFLNFIETLGNDYTQSTNKFLAITLLMSKLESELFVYIDEILEATFDFKDKTNLIFLEGVDGVTLLTREEVASIIEEMQVSLLS